MVTQFERFKGALEKMLMLDQADLDFGIYRIMNQKRTDIEKYLNNDLKKQVTEAVSGSSTAEVESLKTELARAIQNAQDLGVDPETLPKVKDLRAKLSEGGDTESLENEVYSHLTTFFSRYYDGGDFISQRRYKKDVYAIPYEGEEVKLHWANADQYYIKTSECFRSYRFTISNGKKVDFSLKEASVEQNNNLARNNMEHRFALFEEHPIDVEGDTLYINFTYELYPKAKKQNDFIVKAYDTVKGMIPTDFAGVFEPRPTEKDRSRTLLQKHLNDYVARNTFDYFIHKDLNGFLSRELDFFIKNEILVIDDIDAQNPKDFVQHLSVIKAIKTVGKKIITFLASLEDFQKKLWLKKKFVVQSDYCITLDRIPEDIYPEICANDKQREEWVRLFAIDKIEGDLTTEAYSIPLSLEFLRQNPFLVLDTAFFGKTFKHKLQSILSDNGLDAQCNGLLIKSENFQALRLISTKYKKSVSCIYIDPPFNLKQNGDFLYRTDYKDSTWSTLLHNRLCESTDFMSDNSFFYLRCDNNGNHLVRHIMNNVFGEDKFLSEILVQRIRKNVTGQGRISLPLANDSLFLYSNTDEYVFHNPYVKLKETREAYWRRVDDSSGFRNPPTRILFGKEFKPYKYDAHFKYSQESMDRMVTEGRMRIICKNCGEPHYKGNWTCCPKCGCTDATPQYKVEATDKIILDTNWLDIAGYSSKTGFSTENAEVLLDRAIEVCSAPNDIVMDYFGGSGTTMAVAAKKNRKYIGIEMGDQFETFIEPRMRQICFSGISHCFKYMRLEQYEDTLNNLIVKSSMTTTNENGAFYDGYMLGYLLDTETKASLFNLEWFRNPWNTKLFITRQNETKEENIDLIETFNYLIGLNVETILYPKEGICTVEGVTRSGERTLVIWRNVDMIDNEALNKFFEKQAYSTKDSEFDRIYVNGDCNLENLRTDEESWKVVLTEKEFAKRMFEDC